MGAGPMALAARSMRSRAPGANSQRQAPSQAWCRGSARHPTSPHTCSARRRARDTWEPSPGLPSSRQGLFTSPGRAPFAPAPPTRKGQHAPAQGGGLSAPLSSSDFNQSWKGVSFSPNRPPTPSSFPQPLPFPATSQTDRQETQRRREKKTTAPPGPILRPTAGGSRGGSTSSLLLIRIRWPGQSRTARSLEVAEGEEVRVEEAETRQSERASETAREKKISNKTTLTRPLPGCNILWK